MMTDRRTGYSEHDIKRKKIFRPIDVAVVVVAALSMTQCVSGRSVSGKDAPCELFHYYDGGTEKCEHCRDLCDHAIVWKWERQCQAECADYMTAQTCRQGVQYFDEQTGSCSSCQELCQHQDIRGTSLQCISLCPDYKPQKTPDTKGPMPDTEISTPRNDDLKIRNESPVSESHQMTVTIIIISVVAAFIVVVVAIAVVAVCLRVSRRGWTLPAVKYQPASVTDAESQAGNDSGVQVILETGPPRYSKPETQPGILSKLVTTGN